MSSTDELVAAQNRDWARNSPAGDRSGKAGIVHSTRLPAELIDRLFAEARRRETTLAEVIRDLVETGLTAAELRAAADAHPARGAARRRPPARPGAGWDSLTPTERAVAELVADGLIYREVGERLFISRRTVETHVARMFSKLGISNRRELAALVRRHHQDGAETADHLG